MRKPIFIILGCAGLVPWAGRAADLAGNWSDVSASRTTSSGFTLSVQKSGAGYSCFIDDYDLDFVDYFATDILFNPATLQFHIDWAAPGGFSFDGILGSDNQSLSCTLSNAFGLFPVTLSREPSLADFQAGAFTDASGTLPYRLFVPPGYPDGNPYPLVIFLHGAGERGTDNVAQVTANIGFLNFISQTNQLRNPCLLVAPQCPSNGNAIWADALRRVQLQGMLSFLEAQFQLDTNRIYVTGLSMGGIGSWDQISQYPGVYAAAVPLSGGGDVTLAPEITGVPVWNFHAANDSVVDVSFSRAMINAVRVAGGNPIYSEYATGGHAIWSIAYHTPGLVDWVMAQRLGQPATGNPRVAINAPTSGPTFSTSETNIDLTGTAGDASEMVSGLNAFNVQAGVFAFVNGTTNWSASGVPLQAGQTDRILVTAVGTSWSPVLGGNTSFSASLLVTQVAAPIMLNLTREGGNGVLAWSGGYPPYVIQQRTNLNFGDWESIQTNNGTVSTLPMAYPEAFYRVRTQ